MQRMSKRWSLVLLVLIGLGLGMAPKTVHADQITTSEQRQIKSLRQRYGQLSHQAYDESNSYQPKPQFKTKLQPGKLTSRYQDQLLAYLNFYRSLAALPAVRYGLNTTAQAQTAAADMAAANGFSHGLKGLKRPGYVTKAQWQTGQQVTMNSNIGEMNVPERLDATMGNYVRDNFNVEGNNTGHRAWLLSPIIHTVGIGVAYKPQATFAYSDIYFADQSDDQRSIVPNRAQVINYPTAGVFPSELLKTKVTSRPVYWSSNFTVIQKATGTVKVTVTDLTTNKRMTAKNVHLDQNQHFGHFASILTYRPAGPVTDGHHYQVKVTGLSQYPKGYQYSFLAFSLAN
ncbi:CAP domain-containing protein [Furfurilactobacillus sp. WILCCON 0119]